MLKSILFPYQSLTATPLSHKIWLGFLLACILVHGTHLVDFSWNRPIDFRNLYLGSAIWFEHQDPYQDSILKSAWQVICARESIPGNEPPGLPLNFLVYPPSALLLYLPFQFLSWKVASLLNILLCMAALFLFMKASIKFCKADHHLLAPALICTLAFKGTFHALVVGQPTFLCLALASWGLCFAMERKTLRAGIFIGIALFKPTILLPYVLFLIYKKRWNVLLVAALIHVILFAIAIWYWGPPLELIGSFQENVGLLREMVYDPAQQTYRGGFTELVMLIGYFAPAWFAWRYVLYGSIFIALATYLFRKKSRLDDTCTWSLILLLSLLCTYHFFYDIILLAPMLIMVLSTGRKLKKWFAVASIPLFIPINGILQRFVESPSMEWLYFITPLSLLCFLLLMLSDQNLSQKAAS